MNLVNKFCSNCNMKFHSISPTFLHKYICLLFYMLSVQGQKPVHQKTSINDNVDPPKYENQTQVIHKAGAESRLRLPRSWFLTPVDCPFTSLIKTLAIVDKSLMIEDVVRQNTTPRVILAPKYWCKSTNLNMLAFFFSQSLNEMGERLPKNFSAAYHYFKNGEVFVKGKAERFHKKPLISNKKDIIEHHLGEYAVIYVDLNDISIGIGKINRTIETVRWNITLIRYDPDYQTFSKSFMKRIVQIFKQFEYLEKILINFKASNQLEGSKENDLVTLRKYLSTKTELSEQDLKNSLHFLTRIIAQYTSTEVIILCDEYDAVHNSLYSDERTLLFTSGQKMQAELITKFMNAFMTATFQENKFYKRAILAGINKIYFDMKTIISNLYDTDTDDVFTPYFGFSYKELQDLLELRGLANPPDDEVQKRYHQRARFNPWSVMNFFGLQETPYRKWLWSAED